MPPHISHPAIKPNAIESRLYQQNIVVTCINHNTLVILPTALGKTVVSLLASVERMKSQDRKVLVLAPTRPLVLQHCDSFRSFLSGDKKFAVLTGKFNTKKRKEMFETSDFIFATPQVIRNDIADGLYDLGRVCLVVFDEAHRARKKYAYSQIAESYTQQNPDARILALTASPGQDKAHIQGTCDALFIEAVEYRSESDPDVRPYVPPMEVHWAETELPENYVRIKTLLEQMLHEQVEYLQRMHFVAYKKARYVSKKDLLMLGQQLRMRLERSSKASRGFLYEAVVTQSACVSLMHAVEVLSTQDISVLKKFLDKLAEKDSRSAKRVFQHKKFKELMELIGENLGVEHPKFKLLKEIAAQEFVLRPDSRIIVFTQFRDTATKIMDVMKQVSSTRPIRFVGQASKDGDAGLSQDVQAAILRDFRDGKFNVLVATSIAEEGLDIPSVELVIFYEPVPSEIRLIQRRGRTARKKFGRVEILITKQTIDEAYYWSSKTREKKMRSIVSSMNIELKRAQTADRHRVPVSQKTKIGKTEAPPPVSTQKPEKTAGKKPSVPVPEVVSEEIKVKKPPTGKKGQLKLGDFA
jgi:Fanconi anemia group M protein